jgi:hypothetical protein
VSSNAEHRMSDRASTLGLDFSLLTAIPAFTASMASTVPDQMHGSFASLRMTALIYLANLRTRPRRHYLVRTPAGSHKQQGSSASGSPVTA